jgi:hypothetical protein
MKQQFQPRIHVEFSDATHHQLKCYALAATAAGVGALALAQPAEAKIVYTPTHQKIPIRTNFYIDLNHDKISDFRLFIYTGSLTCAMHPRTCSPWDAADMWAYPQVNGNALVGKQPFASALKGGVAVGPKESFDTSRGIMGGVSFINQDLKYSGAWANSGKWRKNRYLGFKFTIKGKTHYGWARFDVRVFRDPKSTVKAIMTGYAYETVANKPIVTGKTDTPVSTLGELAAGAVGRQ